MERVVRLLTLVSCFSVSLTYPPVYFQPEQVHIAFGEDETQMYVVWSTQNDTQSSVVLYSLTGSSQQLVAKGGSTKFVDGGPLHRAQYIHRVKLTGLEPGQKYTYTCGSDYGWSEQFSFKAKQTGNNWSPRLAIYGDLGNINAQSLPRLQLETAKGMYDAILHVGDFAYDMDTQQHQVHHKELEETELCDYAHCLKSNMALICEVVNPIKLLPAMLKGGVLSEWECHLMRQSRHHPTHAWTVLIGAVLQRGRAAYMAFLDSLLQNGYSAVAQVIQEMQVSDNHQQNPISSSTSCGKPLISQSRVRTLPTTAHVTGDSDEGKIGVNDILTQSDDE